MLDLIIKDGQCYIDGELKDVDVSVKDGKILSIGEITEKAKDGPSLALVEGVIPNSIISNVKYSGFIVKYET